MVVAEQLTRARTTCEAQRQRTLPVTAPASHVQNAIVGSVGSFKAILSLKHLDAGSGREFAAKWHGAGGGFTLAWREP